MRNLLKYLTEFEKMADAYTGFFICKFRLKYQLLLLG